MKNKKRKKKVVVRPYYMTDKKGKPTHVYLDIDAYNFVLKKAMYMKKLEEKERCLEESKKKKCIKK